MLRQGMEVVEGLVSQQNFPCHNRSRLDEGIFRLQHGLLGRNKDFWTRVATEILCCDRVWGWDWVIGS